jgi:hypothetical protein
MQHRDFVRPYLDDLLIISCSTIEDHLEKLECVLRILSDKGLRVNAKKSTFCATEIEYLGYWISRSGIQPVPRKVEAIKNVKLPQPQLSTLRATQVRAALSHAYAVTYQNRITDKP